MSVYMQTVVILMGAGGRTTQVSVYMQTVDIDGGREVLQTVVVNGVPNH